MRTGLADTEKTGVRRADRLLAAAMPELAGTAQEQLDALTERYNVVLNTLARIRCRVLRGIEPNVRGGDFDERADLMALLREPHPFKFLDGLIKDDYLRGYAENYMRDRERARLEECERLRTDITLLQNAFGARLRAVDIDEFSPDGSAEDIDLDAVLREAKASTTPAGEDGEDEDDDDDGDEEDDEALFDADPGPAGEEQPDPDDLLLESDDEEPPLGSAEDEDVAGPEPAPDDYADIDEAVILDRVAIGIEDEAANEDTVPSPRKRGRPRRVGGSATLVARGDLREDELKSKGGGAFERRADPTRIMPRDDMDYLIVGLLTMVRRGELGPRENLRYHLGAYEYAQELFSRIGGKVADEISEFLGNVIVLLGEVIDPGNTDRARVLEVCGVIQDQVSLFGLPAHSLDYMIKRAAKADMDARLEEIWHSTGSLRESLFEPMPGVDDDEHTTGALALNFNNSGLFWAASSLVNGAIVWRTIIGMINEGDGSLEKARSEAETAPIGTEQARRIRIAYTRCAAQRYKMRNALHSALEKLSLQIEPREIRAPAVIVKSRELDFEGFDRVVRSGNLPSETWRQQIEMLEASGRGLRHGVRRLFVEAPPGVGKTEFLSLAIKHLAPDSNVVLLAPTILLCEQHKAAIRKANPNIGIGIVADDVAVLDQQLTISTYASYERLVRQGLIPPKSKPLILLDEIHRSLSNLRLAILNYHGDSTFLGTTASSMDIAGSNVSDHFTRAYYISLVQGMVAGIVNPIRLHREVMPGAYPGVSDPREIARRDFEERYKKIEKFFRDLCDGGAIGEKQIVVIMESIARANKVANHLMQAGIRSYAVHSRTSKKQGSSASELDVMFRRGMFPAMVACEMLGEGWDYPALENLALGDQLGQEWEWLQKVGRAGRVLEGKGDSHVLELVGGFTERVLVGDKKRGKISLLQLPRVTPADTIFGLDDTFRSGDRIVERKEGYWPENPFGFTDI